MSAAAGFEKRAMVGRFRAPAYDGTIPRRPPRRGGRSRLDGLAWKSVMASPGVDPPNATSGPRPRPAPAGGRDLSGDRLSGGRAPAGGPARLDWTPGRDAEALLAGPPFERVGKAPDEKPIFALRLGNARYPHMKMQVQPWDCPRRLPALGQHPRPRPGPRPRRPPTPRPSWPCRPRTSGSRSRSSRPGTRPACPTFPRYLRDYLARQSDEAGPDDPQPA